MYMKFIEHKDKPCILLKRECDTTVGCIVRIRPFKDFILLLAKKEEENYEPVHVRIEIEGEQYIFFVENERREIGETWCLCEDKDFACITPPIYEKDLLYCNEETMFPTTNGGKFTAWGDYITPKGLK